MSPRLDASRVAHLKRAPRPVLTGSTCPATRSHTTPHHSVAVGEPSFGIVGPAAIGASVYATAIVGGGFTGGALNPARVLGELTTQAAVAHRASGRENLGPWKLGPL